MKLAVALSNIVGEFSGGIHDLTISIIEKYINEKIDLFYKEYKKNKEINKILNESCDSSKDEYTYATYKLNSRAILSDTLIENIYKETYTKYKQYSKISDGKTPNDLKKDFFIYMRKLNDVLCNYLSESDKAIITILDTKMDIIENKVQHISQSTDDIRKLSEESSKKLSKLYKKFFQEKPFINVTPGDQVNIFLANEKMTFFANTFDMSDTVIGDDTYVLKFLINNVGERRINKIQINEFKLKLYKIESGEPNSYYYCNVCEYSVKSTSEINILSHDRGMLNVLFHGFDTAFVSAGYGNRDDIQRFMKDYDENNIIAKINTTVYTESSSAKYTIILFITNNKEISLSGNYQIENSVIVPEFEN